MKKQKQYRRSSITNHFDLLPEVIIYTILDLLSENPVDKKSFSLTCKWFNDVESKHRKNLKILGQENLSKVLSRCPNITHVDLSLCPRVIDATLTTISNFCDSNLKSIDLSLSPGSGLLNLVGKYRNLVEIDVSNATNLKDADAAALAEAKNLEKLWMGRCQLVTDGGVRCIAVGCKKLRLICLKWCLGVGDFGVGLIAVNCKEIRSLDLSYMRITDECLPSILELPYLKNLVLEGCLSIPGSGLLSLVGECRNLVEIDVSNATNLKDADAEALAKAKNLEKLWMGRCQLVTDRGVGYIAVGCKKLRLICLKWCLGVGDFGVGLIAVNCKEIRSLDLSYMRITDGCLPSILKLQHLEDLVLEGCPFIDDDNLDALEHGCKSLKLSITGRGTLRPNPLGWSNQLEPAWRLRIVNRIMDTLVRLTGHEGLNELTTIARRLEERVFTSATSQPDYLRKISLELLSMESKSQNAVLKLKFCTRSEISV